MKYLNPFGMLKYNFKKGDIVTLKNVGSSYELVEYFTKNAGEIVSINYDCDECIIKYYYDMLPNDIKKHCSHLREKDANFVHIKNAKLMCVRYANEDEKDLYLAKKNSEMYNL